jgi:hypothetical protein
MGSLEDGKSVLRPGRPLVVLDAELLNDGVGAAVVSNTK